MELGVWSSFMFLFVCLFVCLDPPKREGPVDPKKDPIKLNTVKEAGTFSFHVPNPLYMGNPFFQDMTPFGNICNGVEEERNK